mmetsp:Transcript_93714/g.303440  ORF Transcript_93714/g.303440 Transcript_93714/m.303440 type:complete len:365 (-) Transcript_93714:93-1187(-)
MASLGAVAHVPECGLCLWSWLRRPSGKGVAGGRCALPLVEAVALGRSCRGIRWWLLSHAAEFGFVGTLERPGADMQRKAAQELEELGCSVSEVVPGRVYFRPRGTPEAPRGARACGQIGVVVLRHCEDPIGTFLSFPGSSGDACLARIVDVVLAADWSHPLELWRYVADCRLPSSALSFRVRAKRATKQGKDAVSSDAIAEAVGGALADKYGWQVNLSSPDLDIRLQLNREELLVSLSALAPPLVGSGSYLEKAGLHPTISWVIAKTLDIQPGDVVLDPMCGCGVLLCEAAISWPCARAFLGCDLDSGKLEGATRNILGARLNGRVQLLRANVGLHGGLPLPDACVQRLMTDLPFGARSTDPSD